MALGLLNRTFNALRRRHLEAFTLSLSRRLLSLSVAASTSLLLGGLSGLVLVVGVLLKKFLLNLLRLRLVLLSDLARLPVPGRT